MQKSLFYLLVAGLLFSCQAQQENNMEESILEEPEMPSIFGAWEITSITNTEGEESTPYRSVIIYSEGFYSVEIAWENIESWPEIPEGEEWSEEEILSSYGRLTSNSGKYTIEGDSIIHEAIIAKHPNFMNDWPRWATSFTLDGDQLSTIGNRGSSSYRRIK
ncbi:MAG: hypothetical protein ACI8QD_001784 [Cyclobacteriaceae bacterium]|jgi:hypothetical protein